MALTTVDAGLLNPQAQETWRNRIINGAMMIDQRNAGASVTLSTNGYSLDRWGQSATQASKFSVQQNAGSVTPPVGFKNYFGVTSLSAYSLGSSDSFNILQAVEGFNVSDLAWGTVNASPITISFWVRSSLTGTFGGNVTNGAANRVYPYSYTINVANTWEQKSITIAGDTTGTWATDNSIGLTLRFGLGSGSAISGTANVWNAGTAYAPTGATSVVSTSGATFYITGVQLEKGSSATAYDYRPYGTELALCQRYLPVVSAGNGDVSGSGYCATTNTNFNIALPFKVPARTAPTGLTASSAGHFYVQSSSGGGTVTNVTFGAGGVNGAYVTFAAPAGTSGQGCFIQTISNSANLYFNGCEL